MAYLFISRWKSIYLTSILKPSPSNHTAVTSTNDFYLFTYSKTNVSSSPRSRHSRPAAPNLFAIVDRLNSFFDCGRSPRATIENLQNSLVLSHLAQSSAIIHHDKTYNRLFSACSIFSRTNCLVASVSATLDNSALMAKADPSSHLERRFAVTYSIIVGLHVA